MKNKRMKKALSAALGAVLILLIVYGAGSLVYSRVRYRAFYGAARTVESYRGLARGFTPQGVTRTAGGADLVCGYMPGEEPSRIWVYAAGERPKYVTLNNTDGTPYTGHAGGITAAGENVYISNAHRLFGLKTAELEAAGNGDTLTFVSAFPVPCNASFCSSDGAYLYVGEFHADGYDTDASHALQCGDEAFAALVFAYPLSQDGVLAAETPAFVYAVPDEVQGFAVGEGLAYVSRSRGFSSSAIETYDVTGSSDGSFNLDGDHIPLYYLGKTRLRKSLPAPHMSEDLELRGGVLLVGFESGARKFGCGLLPACVEGYCAMELS